ncbi:MAG: DUF721 domain-containing protein [Acidobacteriota bacterium]|nr:DUF721 domain-containing protein [Acidobacteriota bacterium]
MNELFRALPALLRQMEDNESLRQAVVFAAWRRIAGEGLREHAVPLRLFQKHLIVAVMSETWKKHLEHLSGQMIFKLNSTLEQPLVTFIEFRVDEETVKEERAKSQKKALDDERQRQVALEQVTPQMRRAADRIKDENLRYQFLLAAGSCLARKKNMK